MNRDNTKLEEQPIKPITLVHEEFVSDLTNIINNSKLPAFIIEPILKDLYLEIKAMAQRQLSRDKEIYNQSLQSHEESRWFSVWNNMFRWKW